MSEKEPRFGEVFPIDPTNRMDVLKAEEGLPEYILFGREIREKLKKHTLEEGWPRLPEHIESIEDFFDEARNAVTNVWEEGPADLLKSKQEEWSRAIPKKKEYTEAIALLSRPESFEKEFAIQQFGALEPLRVALPDAWRSLVIASSERQLASLAVTRRWSRELPDETLEKMGLRRKEIDILIDSAAVLGKYIDHAYVKQMEIADAPGGSKETKLTGKKGAWRVYDTYRSPDNDAIDVKTYNDVFPYEWPVIARRLRSLAETAKNAFERGELPDSYRNFPIYLEHMAETYGSESVALKNLDAMWDRLISESEKLMADGCPIMFVPQGNTSIAGDADKTDVEIRFGIRTKTGAELEGILEKFREVAEDIRAPYKKSLASKKPLPKAYLNFQPFAFGPNLYWMTRGEEGMGRIISHTNANLDSALVIEMPLLLKMFGIDDIDEGAYGRAAVIETGFHEISHTTMPENDPAVHKRIGVGSEEAIVEELKGEVVGAKILLESFKRGVLSRNELGTQFFAKVGTLLGYLAKKSDVEGSDGEKYFFAGIAMLDALLKGGGIVESKGSYVMRNAELGLGALASIADQFLAMYADDATTPARIKTLGQKLREKKKSPAIKDFLDKLRMRSGGRPPLTARPRHRL